MNRYDAQTNYVAPEQVRPTQLIELPPADISPTNTDGVWLAKDSNSDSSMGRSQALIVRLIPFSLLWFILSVAVCIFLIASLKADATTAGVFSMVCFVLVTAYTYIKMDSQERYDSPVGVEHHKIDSATYLAERKMDMDDAHRKQLTTAYLKQLEVNNGTRSIGCESSPAAGRKQLPDTRQPR